MQDNCQSFGELYHCNKPGTSPQISHEYVCPQTGPGGIETIPVHPWFMSQQSNEKMPNVPMANGSSHGTPTCNGQFHPWQYDPVVTEASAKRLTEHNNDQTGGNVAPYPLADSGLPININNLNTNVPQDPSKVQGFSHSDDPIDYRVNYLPDLNKSFVGNATRRCEPENISTTKNSRAMGSPVYSNLGSDIQEGGNYVGKQIGQWCPVCHSTLCPSLRLGYISCLNKDCQEHHAGRSRCSSGYSKLSEQLVRNLMGQGQNVEIQENFEHSSPIYHDSPVNQASSMYHDSPVNQASPLQQANNLYHPLPVNKNEPVPNYHMTPSWYFDTTQEHIGKRPVLNSVNKISEIPKVLVFEKTNLPNRRTNCNQPVWDETCI